MDQDVPVVIMTAFGEIETAIEAIKRGAFHYVSKPFKIDEILSDRRSRTREPAHSR